MNIAIVGGLVAGLVTVSSIAYGQWERVARVEAVAELRTATDLLRSNEAALVLLRKERATTVEALSGVTEALRTSAASMQEARNVTYAAPRTTSCVAHPGVRALRDSLRRRVAAPGPGRAPAPS
jgi:hypothetical protein